METRKIIGYVMLGLAGLVTVYTLVRTLTSGMAKVDEYEGLVALVVVVAALAVAVFKPEWNGQCVFDFKERRFRWKQKPSSYDTQGYRQLMLGLVALWFSLLMTGVLLEKVLGSPWFGKLFLAMCYAVPLMLGVIIWCAFRIRKNITK